LLRQLRRSKKSPGIIVPKIEQFMKRPVEIEDDEDRQFLANLIEARSIPRTRGVYSPSMLSNCLRQVYFVKTGVKYARIDRIESNGYFLDGNFRHFKWQFLIWKMHREGIFDLVDVGSVCIGTEIPVRNSRGDFRGTIDNLIYVPDFDIVTILDWKGMNGNSFNGSLANGPSKGYKTQSVGYARLANESLKIYDPASFDPNYPPETQKSARRLKIEDIFIIGENKNGPVNTRLVKAPLALVEWRVNVKENSDSVIGRIKALRGFERRGETPPVECTTTRSYRFKDCPFAPICRAEIEASERRTLRRVKSGAIKKKEKEKPKVNIIKIRKTNGK
jgi:hypothetical protein